MRFKCFFSLFFIFFITISINTSILAKKAAIIIDYDTQKVLFEVNADTLNYPASLTKMMTIYIIFDYLNKSKLSWDGKLSVSKNASLQPRSKLYVKEGEYITVRNAVNALIIKSANDVATVVAENISGTERKFAKLMTAYARDIGMEKTTFKNASGLNNRAQLTTARDMSILSYALISKFPEYYKLFSQKSFIWDNKKYKTHNKLMINYQGADGIKTGYISPSGFQLAFSAVRNNKRLIGIYFGGDTAKQRDRSLNFLMNKAYKDIGVENLNKKSTKSTSSINNYKIVVGTFKYKKNAEKQIKIIRKNYPKTSSNKKGIIVKVKVRNKHMYETRFQFFSKKEAVIACNRLKKYKRDCFIRG